MCLVIALGKLLEGEAVLCLLFLLLGLLLALCIIKDALLCKGPGTFTSAPVLYELGP